MLVRLLRPPSFSCRTTPPTFGNIILPKTLWTISVFVLWIGASPIGHRMRNREILQSPRVAAKPLTKANINHGMNQIGHRNVKTATDLIWEKASNEMQIPF
jgi:hypothetical protein